MDLVTILFPAFLIFLTGFIGQKTFRLHIKSITTMALYLMTPFLVFETFYTHELNSDYLYLMLFTTLLMLLLIVVTIFMGKLNKLDKTKMSALLLGSAFPNSGNYGAPVALFAFGAVGFNYAVIIMVTHALLINTIGIFIASYGSKNSTNMKEIMFNVLKMPVFYAAVIGVILQVSPITLPLAFTNGISLVSSAAIPTVMLILGMQLAEIKFQKLERRNLNLMIILRMFISPILSIILVLIMPVSIVVKQVFILLGAMPIAANTTLLAVQFDVESELVSFATLVTTIISIFTIPIILFLINNFI